MWGVVMCGGGVRCCVRVVCALCDVCEGVVAFTLLQERSLLTQESKQGKSLPQQLPPHTQTHSPSYSFSIYFLTAFLLPRRSTLDQHTPHFGQKYVGSTTDSHIVLQ